jgi:hypothetical protein
MVFMQACPYKWCQIRSSSIFSVARTPIFNANTAIGWFMAAVSRRWRASWQGPDATEAVVAILIQYDRNA